MSSLKQRLAKTMEPKTKSFDVNDIAPTLYKELLEFILSSMTLHGKAEPQLEDYEADEAGYQMYDVEGSGSCSLQEVMNAFKTELEGYTKEQVQEIIGAINGTDDMDDSTKDIVKDAMFDAVGQHGDVDDMYLSISCDTMVTVKFNGVLRVDN